MAGSGDRAGPSLPRGALSSAGLVRALQGDEVLLAGGPVPLEEDLLYLLVRMVRGVIGGHVLPPATRPIVVACGTEALPRRLDPGSDAR